MSYGFDTKRDEAYTEGPLSSATMTLMRVAGKLHIDAYWTHTAHTNSNT